MTDHKLFADEPPVRCKLVHAGGDDSDAMTELLFPLLEPYHGNLLIRLTDGETPAQANLGEFDVHAVLYLLNERSETTAHCAADLADARRRHIPIFIIRLGGGMPAAGLAAELLDWPLIPEALRLEKLRQLTFEVWLHGTLFRQISGLEPSAEPEVLRQTAKFLAESADPSAVATFIDLLNEKYNPELDSTTRFWLSIALGQTGNPRAIPVLKDWERRESQTVLREGIREALAMLGE